MASTALDESPVLKRGGSVAASEVSLKKHDEEKAATKVFESETSSTDDDESEIETGIIEKAEDVAIKVRLRVVSIGLNDLRLIDNFL